MSNRGVSISSLLSNSNNDTANSEPTPDPSTTNTTGRKTSLKNLVSMFQPNIKLGGPEAPITILDEEPPTPPITQIPSPIPVVIGPSVPIAPKAKKPKEPLADHIKRFQSDFKFEIPNSKTSISSIMNVDRSPSPVNKVPISNALKIQQFKANPELIITNDTSVSGPSANPTEGKSPKKRAPKRKTEPKKPVANKKAKTPIPEEIQPKPVEIINLPPPEVLDLSTPETAAAVPNDKEKETKETAKETKDPPKDTKDPPKEPPRELELGKKEEEKELPIIALNIPLLDPKNPKGGKSDFVVNVLKMAEDKYGWSAIHPNAKSALEVLDESSDDDLEEDDDEEADKEKGDKEKDEEKDKSKDKEKVKEKEEKKKELTEEQLIRQHETRMNRKVGKYDYLDPFIDDFELELEEGISSTKEGFFVYWGPIVDDRNNAKKASKGKR